MVKYLKDSIINMRKIAYKAINKRKLKKYGVIYKDNLCINGLIFISGRNIKIGNNVVFNSGQNYNPIGGDNKLILFTQGEGEIIIGDNVGISNSAINSRQKIIIEDNVMIGGGCKIYDTDFHSIAYESRIMKPDINVKNSPVTIKNGAFIGAHSIILKGVTIGEKSIIGAGSVVTKSVPDGEIWAGNPARLIKKI